MCSRDKESGIVLPMVLIVMSVLFILGVSLLTLTNVGIKATKRSEDSYKAQNMADSGIELALGYLSKDPAYTGTLLSTANPYVSNTGGKINQLGIEKNGTGVRITSTGYCNGVTKTVQAEASITSGMSFETLSLADFALVSLHDTDEVQIGTHANIEGSLYSAGPVHIKNDNNKKEDEVTIRGNVFVDDSLTFHKHHAFLTPIGAKGSPLVWATQGATKNGWMGVTDHDDDKSKSTVCQATFDQVGSSDIKGVAVLLKIPDLGNLAYAYGSDNLYKPIKSDYTLNNTNSGNYYIEGNVSIGNGFIGKVVTTGNVTTSGDVTANILASGKVSISGKLTGFSISNGLSVGNNAVIRTTANNTIHIPVNGASGGSAKFVVTKWKDIQ